MFIGSQGGQIVVQILFYNEPTPPPGTFDNFTNIPSISSDLKTRSYLDMVLSTVASSSPGLR